MEKIRRSLLLIKTEAKIDINYLINLVDAIRPGGRNQENKAEENLKFINRELENDPELRKAVNNYFSNILQRRRKIKLFTELGILSAGLLTEIIYKFFHRILPAVEKDDDLYYTIGRIFRRTDYKWVRAIPVPVWTEFLRLAGFKEIWQLPGNHPMKEEIVHSLSFISHRVAGIGLSPNIVHKLPELNRPESPFIMQNRELIAYLEKLEQKGLHDLSDPDYKHLLVMLTQCEAYADEIRRKKYKFGASLSLTNLMIRLQQNLRRMRALLGLLYKNNEEAAFEKEVRLFVELMELDGKKHDLRALFSANASLIAHQIVEFSGNTGDHYISRDQQAYFRLFAAALGGGMIVAFFALFKAALKDLHLSEFGMAFLYSMNYAAGFILIYITHSTLATKHPAMTAPRIARELDDRTGESASIKNLVPLVIRLIRSQFVAFAGNILAAFAIAFLIGNLFHEVAGHILVNAQDAGHMIVELHPTRSLALLHAAIAGLCLFFSGIISGFFDNQTLYHAIPQRIKKLKLLRRVLRPKQIIKLSYYMERNLGGLAGNFALGVFLGSAGPLGDILGLPIDIRHVTFSSANFGIAMTTFADVSTGIILTCLLGIILIGFINFSVSFGLAFYVAIKARHIKLRQSPTLAKLLALHLLRYPLDFILPTNEDKLSAKAVRTKRQEG